MECSICVEKFNKKRIEIECPYCHFISCIECWESFIKELRKIDISCMSCKKEYSQKDLYNMFSIKFIKGPIKNHREEILFEQQKALLPGTQELALNEINKRNTILRLKQLEEERKLMLQEYRTKMKENKERVRYYQQKIQDAIMYYNEMIAAISTDKPPPVKEKFTALGKCSECKGYVDNTYKCTLCSVEYCKHCFCKKDDSKHKCDPDKKKTYELIKQDTKPCPGCATLIHRIEGCYQMWCTICHTTFDWKTGQKVEEKIHNPHYMEFIRKNPGLMHRTINNCVDRYLFGDAFETLRNFKAEINKMEENADLFLHRILTSIGDLPKEKISIDNLFQKARVRYLVGDIISENSFKREVFRIENTTRRINEIIDIYISTEILIFNLVAYSTNYSKLKRISIRFLHESNKEIERINTYYGSVSKKEYINFI